MAMSATTKPPTVVLAHGAWADGSSWTKVIAALHQTGTTVTAAPIPLTTLADDIAALAPDENETVADVFYRDTPHPQAPQLVPDADDYLWLPDDAFPSAFAQRATPDEHTVLAARIG
jgi:hypothetical protein